MLTSLSLYKTSGYHQSRLQVSLANATRQLEYMLIKRSGYNTIQALKVLPKIVPSPDKAKIRLMVGLSSAYREPYSNVTKTIFFGANDAASDEYVEGIPVQRVPLAQYKENLINIATDPCVQAHKPSLVIITPPPVDEYPMAISDKSRGFKEVKRTAERTKSYADAAKEVGKELGIPVLDAWTAFMKKAGWKEGDPLVGSQSVPRSPVFEMLMYDGEFAASAYYHG